MKRLLGLSTAGLMLLAACGGSASAPSSAAPSSVAPASIASSAAAKPSAAASTAASAAASTGSSAAASTGAAASAAASGAAAPAASGKVTITFWHTQSGANQQTLNDMVAAFNQSHPNIQVNAENVGTYDDEYQKLLAAAKANALPDVAVAYENVVSDLMKANAVVPRD
ncbi:MAG: extracellular solute-binding protein, partial [Chloroflexi bacterium]|nr:extracellular solute-binding protein [Chloroflexota bacterium]